MTARAARGSRPLNEGTLARVPSLAPDRKVNAILMRQEWRSATFFHWEYPPEVLRPLIPTPLELDLFDDRAWVGLTPFTTTFTVGGMLPLPGPRRYPETNLRTYVRAPDGTDGVWFFSLDVTNLSNVPIGRLGMPYYGARLSVEQHDDTIRYRGHRLRGRSSKGPRYDLTVRAAADEQAQTELEIFLTGRWHTYTKRLAFLGRFDIEHEPWPLHRAELISGEQHMTEHIGLPAPMMPPVVHSSPGVDVAISWPTPLRARVRA